MDQDHIRQLQRFSEERSKLLELISSIRSSPGLFRSDAQSSAALKSATTSCADVSENLIDSHYQRLTQALGEMQTQIEQRVRPAVQSMVQTEVDALRHQFEQNVAALTDCRNKIDQSILRCVAGLTEYQKCYLELATLNKQLAGLGVAPEPILEHISLDQLSESISLRIANLARH